MVIIVVDLQVRSIIKGVQAACSNLYLTLLLFGYTGSNYSSAVLTSQFVANETGFSTQEVVSDNQYVLLNSQKQYITTIKNC